MAQEFDSYAAEYDELLDDPWRTRFTRDPSHFAERKLVVLLALLKRAGRTPARMRWLDIGCGRAELLAAGQSVFASVTGCDVSGGMLQHARSVPVVLQTDASRLPFEPASFDLVTAVCVYHHVEPAARQALAAEMARVLTDDGVAAIVEHNPWNPVVRQIVSRTPVDRDAKLLRASSARALLASGGMSPVVTEYFMLLPQRLYGVAPWVERPMARVPAGGQYMVMGVKGVSTAPAT